MDGFVILFFVSIILPVLLFIASVVLGIMSSKNNKYTKPAKTCFLLSVTIAIVSFGVCSSGMVF